jgi:ribosomal protein S18 acetylase RimI-like enzyme
MIAVTSRDPILGFVEPTIEVRDATVDDEPVLWHVLNYAGGDPDEMRSVDELRADPALARYVEGWGRRGDAGAIAVADGTPVGAAWFRLFPAAEPGYGFVAGDVPELAIFLEPAARGRGVGRTLMNRLSDLACTAGFPTLSLSVRQSNHAALHLYVDLGYEPVDPGATTTSITLTAATYPSASAGK